MRKLLDIVSLIALLVCCAQTYQALYGSDPITNTIATHFDMQGHANNWGSPKTLLLMPALALGNFLISFLIRRFPNAMNYPVRVTPENRPRLQSMALDMLAWIMTETILLFAFLQNSMIQSARQGNSGITVVPIFVCLVAGAITTAWYLTAMRRAAR